MSNETQNKTSTGLTENLAGLLCYLVTWVTGIIFLVIEKENKTVRFHAMQSIITFIPLMVAQWIIGRIPFIGGLLSFAIAVLQVVLWILLMVKAYKGEKFKVPVAGDIAEQQINK